MIAISFEDTSCGVMDITSTWEANISRDTAETQTPSEMFMFEDAEVQTGLYTEIVEEVVSKKDVGANLVDLLAEYHKQRGREAWAAMIREGKVSIDGETVTHPDKVLEPDQYIEFVNEKSNAETEISRADFGTQADEDELSAGSTSLLRFLDNTLPLVEQELKNNIVSKAFDGYTAMREDRPESIELWKILTVDLEKHKVVFPDWSKGNHYAGVIVRCHVTRNKERIYDIDMSDGGSRLNGVREEYIRAILPGVGGDGGRSRRSGGRSSMRLYEGMRLHACVRRGTNESRYLPGRVTAVHRNETVDVECEGGVIKAGLTRDDLLVGLTEGQEVEARRPVIVSMQCTGVSWSCNGSMVVASYGNADVSGWCDSPGAVCTWSVFGRDLNPSVPDFVLDHTVCVMCVRCHPTNPSVVAAGSFNGEVIVWDVNNPEGPLHLSSITEDSHDEPVMGVDWVLDSSLGVYLVCSVGADGKVLLWNLEQGFKKPFRGCMLAKTKVSKRQNYPLAHGGTSLSFSGGLRRAKWLVVGQEGGSIVRAQASRILSAPPPAESSTDKRGGKYASLRRKGETFSHETHIGPVNAIQCSPFHRSLFLTGGQDGTVRLYHMLEQNPLRTWEPAPQEDTDIDSSFAAISCIGFSYTRPAVFAAGSRDGYVYVFDLLSSSTGPVTVLQLPPVGANMDTVAEAKANGRGLTGPRARVSGICFNKKQRDLLAACDHTGRVFVWKMGWTLSNSKQTEQAFIDHLGSVSVDDNMDL
mmetsp:Transcript_14874/g.22368  ORF Transcript_14874/g.22368 Transcript_14874/m.22368 type:complete len:754 (-) Transcript_14874:107-2368(-)